MCVDANCGEFMNRCARRLAQELRRHGGRGGGNEKRTN